MRLRLNIPTALFPGLESVIGGSGLRHEQECPFVPRLSRLTRRAGPLGLMLTAYDIWRRLPPKQRRQALKLARKHGPAAIKAARKFKKKKP